MSVESIDPKVSSVSVWTMPWKILLLIAAAGVLSLWPFWEGVSRMWDAWLGSPEYSHGLLIPPVAAFLIWQQKDALERIDFSGSWWGAALILAGGGLLVIGQLGTVYTIIQYAYVITLYGLILSLLGWRAFRLIATPMLILLFMIPLPQFVLANLSTKLQLVSSEIGVYFMRLFGISVFLEGNVIDLGGYKLEVAEACSGLRYLFPLMTLGFLMAYFYKGAFWKRIVLFLSSIPITVLMNSVRVGTIGLMVENWGIGMAEGFIHEFQGWMVFMVSTALMVVEMATLNRVGKESGTWQQVFGVELPARTPTSANQRVRRVPAPFVAAALTLTGFAVIAFVMPRPTDLIPARSTFSEFPLQIGPWRGKSEPMEAVFSDALHLDDYLMANFQGGSGAVINFYMAYYNSQRKGEAVHSPRSCLPGGGWQMRDFGQREIASVVISGQRLRVNRAVVELGNQRELVYYWFQQRGRVITNEFAVKWYLFWDALTRHRTDGALVRLIISLPPAAAEVDADRRLTDFVTRIAPDLTRYIPD